MHQASCSCRGGVGEWYVRYGPMIRQFTLSRTGDPVTADDCTSETFLRALRGQGSFRCRGDGVRPWLITIARNIVQDLRKSSRMRYEELTDTVSEIGDDGANPEVRALRRDELRELEQCLRQLPGDQMQCLRLRFFEDLSVRQTSLAMGRSENAVRTLQHRAVHRLAGIVAAAAPHRPSRGDDQCVA